MRNTYAENTMGTRIREMRKAAGMSQEQLAGIHVIVGEKEAAV